MRLTTLSVVMALVTASTALVDTGSRGDGSIPVSTGASMGEAAMLERFLRSGTPELTSYAARRLLTASTRSGRMQARLEAWTYLDPDGTFRFNVVCAHGSGVIQKRVLVAALEAERRSRQDREARQAALTLDNYEFLVTALPADDMREIRLRPRRKSQMLIEGSAFVRETSADLVRIEGRLSKTPSWWTRRVEIIRRYARIGGVRVPVEMTSTADVRFVGISSFAMTYDYAMINGEAFAGDVSPRCESGDQASLRPMSRRGDVGLAVPLHGVPIRGRIERGR